MTERLAKIKLIALDVDGTLTDGGLVFGNNGEELKRFHAHDGLGIVLGRGVGLETAWITGRESEIVGRRAKELGVRSFLTKQGVRDKAKALQQIADIRELSLDEIAYVGDDLNDLPAMGVAGVTLCPADATPHVRNAVDIVLTKNGGQGAVREAIEQILQARGDYTRAIRTYLDTLAVGQ